MKTIRILMAAFAFIALASGCDNNHDKENPTPPAETARFVPLAFTNDNFQGAIALAISDDGKTVAGSCVNEDANFQPVLWNSTDGSVTRLPFMHNIPVPGFPYNAWVNGISNNGVLAGNQAEIDLNPNASYFKDGDWHFIIDPDTGGKATTAKAISSNGDTIVGRILDPGGPCTDPPCIGGYFHRVSTGEFEIIPSTFDFDMGDCDDEGVRCHIDFYAVTGDGLIAAGNDNYFSKPSPEKLKVLGWPLQEMVGTDAVTLVHIIQPVIYDLSGDSFPVRLPLPDNYQNGMIRGISRDGTAIAGGALDLFKPTIAVWWDADLNPHKIGSLGGPDTDINDTIAVATSNGGKRIVGISKGEAFIYEPASGIQSLEDYLKKLGLGSKLEGWTLINAVAITPDGHYIVGNGTNGRPYQQGFVVYIP